MDSVLIVYLRLNTDSKVRHINILLNIVYDFVVRVYIAVGGNSSYKVLEMEYKGCTGLSPQSNQQFDPPYDIDWCKFTLVRLLNFIDNQNCS